MAPVFPPSLALCALLLVQFVLAQHDHSEHDDGGSSIDSGTSHNHAGQMIPYLHTTTGDALWFQAWAPKSTATVSGACVGLFLLAIFERWLAACRGVAEQSWARSTITLTAEKAAVSTNQLPTASESSPASPRPELKHSASSFSPPLPSLKPTSKTSNTKQTPPFILAQDLSRGLVHTAQTALGFAMMLAVMTFHIGFIISLVIGLGVGETLFGRFAHHAAHL